MGRMDKITAILHAGYPLLKLALVLLIYYTPLIIKMGLLRRWWSWRFKRKLRGYGLPNELVKALNDKYVSELKVVTNPFKLFKVFRR